MAAASKPKAEEPAEPAAPETPSAPEKTATKRAGAAPKSRRAGKANVPKARRRPTLPPATAALLEARADGDRRRPKFTRQASYRYWRIGRDEAWRKPRGLQSKQRRHYGYRSAIVRIGYRGPAVVRGLTPSGFRPVLVHNAAEMAGIAPATDAAIIARTVGTRRRLALEEAARKAGIHVLNPISRDEEE